METGGIVAAQLTAVQISYETIFIFHAQCQLINDRDVLDDKWNADVYRLINVSHRANVKTDQTCVIISDAGASSNDGSVQLKPSESSVGISAVASADSSMRVVSVAKLAVLLLSP